MIQECYLCYPFFNNLPNAQPMLILQMSLREKGQPEIQKIIENYLISLRLFKLGSVFNMRTFWKSDSILNFGGITFSYDIYAPTYKYSLSVNDTSKLEKFFEVILPLIPLQLLNPNITQIDYSIIAIQRYHDAILKPEPIESKLAFAIMSLESLYLKESERGELEHRLSQRLAKLLSLCGYEPIEVYNTVKRSYDIRSNFVHGSPIPQESLQEASKLAEKVIDYTRLSILIFLQIKPKIEKEDLLNLIDRSLLHVKANEKLVETINTNCLVKE